MTCPCCNAHDHNADDLQGWRGLTRGEICQLFQLKHAGHLGVHAGDLMDKESTRELVRRGLADNPGGSPSALNRVYASRIARTALETLK